MGTVMKWQKSNSQRTVNNGGTIRDGGAVMQENDARIIDIHTHILPGIDDGSRSVEESRTLIDTLFSQGVSTVVATPHYYPTDSSPEEFLEKRQKSEDLLRSSIDLSSCELFVGAEVLYFQGISRIKGLDRLCTKETDMFLLEMPTQPWTEYSLREITEISNTSGITVVMAHIDRYVSMQQPEVFEMLADSGVKMQVNADSFLHFRSSRRMLQMLKNGCVHFLGTDCHGTANRPPRMDEAVNVIKKKAGDGALEMLSLNCNDYLRKRERAAL